MTALDALGIAVGVCLILSTALCIAIFRPLQSLLRNVCPGLEAVTFWERFSLIMLFLAPLFVSIVWGLPPAGEIPKEDPGSILQRIIATGLVGAFLAMLGMGFWVSALARRAPNSSAVPTPRDKETWGERRDS